MSDTVEILRILAKDNESISAPDREVLLGVADELEMARRDARNALAALSEAWQRLSAQNDAIQSGRAFMPLTGLLVRLGPSSVPADMIGWGERE